MIDKFNIKGELRYTLYDEFGNIKLQGTDHNLITQGFEQNIADTMGSGTTAGQARFMAIGSGAGQGVTSSGLQHFMSVLALSGTGSPVTAGSTCVYSAYWAAGAGTGSIREAGVFRISGTAMSGGLLTYNDSISINKGASDSLKIDWTAIF